MNLQISNKLQLSLATILCYAGAWLGFALGVMWLWLGWLALQPNATTNAVFNPVLLFDGTVVIIASLFVAQKSKTATLLISGYALFMEIYMQLYQVLIGADIKFKPYFLVEILALIMANVGVFWWHTLNNKIKTNAKKT